MIVLICGERDSRGRCSREKMLVEVYVRNASLSTDVEKKLSELHLGTCIRPGDIRRMVHDYTTALHNGTFFHFFTYIITSAEEVMFSSLFVCLSVSNFRHELSN